VPWQYGGAISVQTDASTNQFRVVLSGCAGRNNTDNDGKALAFSGGAGVTQRSLTDGAQSAS